MQPPMYVFLYKQIRNIFLVCLCVTLSCIAALALPDDGGGHVYLGTDLFAGIKADSSVAPSTPFIVVTFDSPTSVLIAVFYEDEITGYTIERSLAGTDDFTLIADLTADVSAYQDTGLTPATAYTYRAATYNAYDTSAYAFLTVETPAPPVPSTPVWPVSYTTTHNQVEITWLNDTDAYVSGMVIARSTSPTEGFTDIDTLETTSNTLPQVFYYVDAGLAAETTYYYRIAAFNDEGISDYSEPVAFQTLAAPAVPLSPDVVAALMSTGFIMEFIQKGEVPVTGYIVERSLAGTDDFIFIADVSADVATYQDTGLTPATTYTYRVAAYNAYGTSDSTSFTVETLPPVAPPTVTVVITSPTALSMIFAPHERATYYTIERAFDDTDDYVFIANVFSAVGTYQDTGLTPGTTYTYRIAAHESFDVSDYIYIPIQMPPLQIPPTPDWAVSYTATYNQITLDWTNETDAYVDGIVVIRSIHPREKYVEVATISTESMVLPYTITMVDSGLEFHTTYYYRIAAFNDQGISDYSSPITAATTPLLSRMAINPVAEAITAASNDTAAGIPGLTVYPNKTKGDLTVDLGTMATESVKIDLRNITGEEIPFQQQMVDSTHYRIQFQGESGLYVVRIYTEQGTRTLRIVKE